MKKILYISSISLYPVDSGGARVIHSFLEHEQKNSSIYLLTVKSNPKLKKTLKNIRIYDDLSKNSFIKFFSPQTFFSFIRLVRKIRPDSLVIEFPWFGMYGYIMEIFFGISYSIREHNIEYLRFKRLNKWWWKILRAYEEFVYTYADKIYCISKLDANKIIRDFGVSRDKIIITPYIPDKNIFRLNKKAGVIVRKELGIDKEPVILFFGPLDYQPNMEAVNTIIHLIAPAVWKKNSKVKFIIAGKNPPSSKFYKQNIIFTGYVEKIQDYINASDIVIVPLKSGGGFVQKF